MQYQQTPQDLSSIFGAGPVSEGGGGIAATPYMMGLLNQQQNADQMTGQDQARQLSFDTANDPLKLARSGLDNSRLSAELPGVVADTATKVRNNSNSDLLNDANLKDQLSKLDSDTLSNHVKDFENLGQTALQQYSQIYMNPFGGADRAKQSFQKAGYGDMWNDDWNDLPAGELAAKLKDFGTGIQDQAQKLRQNMLIQGAKNEGIYGKTNLQGQNAIDLEEKRQEGRVALNKLKVELKPAPAETMSQWEARMRSKADDPTAQAALNKWLDQKEAIASAGVNVNDAFKRQVIGIPKTSVQVPQGFKDNGDGTYTTPSGAIVKPPGQ